jgi:hypothetical protein
MCDQDRYTKGKRVNYKELRNKEEAKLKRLRKEQERLARAPSCRLGKNDKKQTARTNIILDEQIERIQEATATDKQNATDKPNAADKQNATDKQKRVVLRKQKRKESHRDLTTTRIQVSDHLPDLDEEEFDDLTTWSKNISWFSEEIEMERHKLVQSWQGAIYEMEEEKSSEKWCEWLKILNDFKRKFPMI